MTTRPGTAAPDAARILVAAALECPLEDIPGDGTMQTIPGWDSIGHVKIMLAIEERIGRRVAPAEMTALNGVADVGRLLEKATTED